MKADPVMLAVASLGYSKEIVLPKRWFPEKRCRKREKEAKREMERRLRKAREIIFGGRSAMENVLVVKLPGCDREWISKDEGCGEKA